MVILQLSEGSELADLASDLRLSIRNQGFRTETLVVPEDTAADVVDSFQLRAKAVVVLQEAVTEPLRSPNEAATTFVKVRVVAKIFTPTEANDFVCERNGMGLSESGARAMATRRCVEESLEQLDLR